MTQRKLALIVLLTLVVSTIASFEAADLVSANYFPPPSIEFFSPISIKTYSESSVELHVRVNALPSESSSITYIRYCLDGKANVTLTDLTRNDGEAYWTSTEGVIATGNAFSVKTTLTNLSEGNHTLTVYSHAVDGTEMSRPIEFTVDYGYVSPQNPFGLPSNLPNGTSTLFPTVTQTPQQDAPTKPLQPANTVVQLLENWSIVFLIISVAAVLLLAAALYFRKKSRKVGES